MPLDPPSYLARPHGLILATACKMWTAANRHILPSAQEADSIKRTIKLLETELVVARELIERTQDRIAALERNLQQEKASISPIRKVPADVLSEIFQICCMEERLAPLTIAAVCFRWRETIISTPLAWTRIFPQIYFPKFPSNEYVSLFLERSQPCLLHIAVPWARRACKCFDQTESSEITTCDYNNVQTVFEHAARIQCLTVDVEWMVEHPTVIFDNLTRLTIIDKDDLFVNTTLTLLDVSRFPKLYYLDISNCLGVNGSIDFSHVTQSQLEYLKIGVEGDWLDIVKACASSLQTLEVDGEFTPSSTQTIDFPRLESLKVTDHGSIYAVDLPVLEVVAPYLAFFELDCPEGPPKIVHHYKLHRVTHLRTRLLPSLRDYPLLSVLHVPNSPGMIDGIIVQLERDLNVSPDLKSIELSTTHHPFFSSQEHHPGDQLQRRVAKRNSTAGSDIELIFNRVAPDNAAVRFTCTNDMPCRLSLTDQRR